jgi:O-methyltransferase involved in polyketide biosynthesis
VKGDRDFSTISPSARSIALVRSQTDLPYAREAAVRLFGEAAVAETAKQIAADDGARMRMVHFERRSRSIDAALAARRATSVLELAAGLSFRGLAMCARPEVCYVDTDLDEMVASKRELVAALAPAGVAGDYRVVALDAMDGDAFAAVVATMLPGPVTIVNEGLLVYLDPVEKARLCATILGVLRERGGAWVTADVDVPTGRTMFRDPATRAFVEHHNVDRNKFASYDEAAAFFEGCGFAIEAREPSSADPGHPRETWVLVPAVTARSA